MPRGRPHTYIAVRSSCAFRRYVTGHLIFIGPYCQMLLPTQLFKEKDQAFQEKYSASGRAFLFHAPGASGRQKLLHFTWDARALPFCTKDHHPLEESTLSSPTNYPSSLANLSTLPAYSPSTYSHLLLGIGSPSLCIPGLFSNKQCVSGYSQPHSESWIPIIYGFITWRRIPAPIRSKYYTKFTLYLQRQSPIVYLCLSRRTFLCIPQILLRIGNPS